MRIPSVFTLFVLLFLATSVVGFVLDRPIFVSYVTSNSMRPTLNKGDIFFINPFSKGKVGDIIVFKMNGMWTVHRIFAETPAGYITKGDNNVATDQQGGFGAVKKDDVAGVVVTFLGKPVKIPQVGNVLRYSSKNVYLAVIVIVVGVLLFVSDSKQKKRRKKKIVIKYRSLYSVVSGIMLTLLLVSIISTWGSIGFSYVSTVAGGQRNGWYLPNTEFNTSITVKNRAIYPAFLFLLPKGDRISISNDILTLMGEEKTDVSVHVKVPGKTHVYYEEIEVYSYPAVLPKAIIKSAWKLSPYAPLMLIEAEFSLALCLVYLFVRTDDVIRVRRWKRI